MSADTEPLSTYLERRERELVHQIAALRGQIEPKERELADVRKARAVLGPTATDYAAPFRNLPQKNSNTLLEAVTGGTASFDYAGMLSEMLSVESKTIKQLILLSLKDHFHQGAKPSDLRDYIRNAYLRDIPLTSLSPQLSRLRDEGMIRQVRGVLNDELWWQLVPGQVGTVELNYDQPKPNPKESLKK